MEALLWCLYCTKLAPTSKTNDVARPTCVVKQNYFLGIWIFAKPRLICFLHFVHAEEGSGEESARASSDFFWRADLKTKKSKSDFFFKPINFFVLSSPKNIFPNIMNREHRIFAILFFNIVLNFSYGN